MITDERLDQVVHVVERAGLNDRTLAALREAFAPLHFTWCQDDDLETANGAGAAVRSTRGFNLYLLDARSHCIRFTTDQANATGLVLAERSDDDWTD